MEIGIPFEQIAELLGYNISKHTLAILRISEWIVIVFGSLGILAFWKKRRDYNSKSYLTRIVVGSGTVVEDGKLLIRSFAEKNVSEVVGEGILADILVSTAHKVTKSPNTQILLIENADDRNIIRSRLTNALNQYYRPEIVKRLAKRSGATNFVTSITCEDYEGQRKIRMVIITEEELRQFLPGFLRLSYEHGQNYHDYRTKLLHELAKKWFDVDQTPIWQNRYAWLVELHG